MRTSRAAGLIAAVVAIGVTAAPDAGAALRHHADCETFTATDVSVSPVIVNDVTVGGHVVKRSTVRIDCPGWRHDTAATRIVTRNVPLAALHEIRHYHY